MDTLQELTRLTEDDTKSSVETILVNGVGKFTPKQVREQILTRLADIVSVAQRAQYSEDWRNVEWMLNNDTTYALIDALMLHAPTNVDENSSIATDKSLLAEYKEHELLRLIDNAAEYLWQSYMQEHEVDKTLADIKKMWLRKKGRV